MIYISAVALAAAVIVLTLAARSAPFRWLRLACVAAIILVIVMAVRGS